MVGILNTGKSKFVLVDGEIGPLYNHDCTKCEFLFSYYISEGDIVDVYKSCQGSLLVRYGNDGPEYESMTPEFYLLNTETLLGKAAIYLLSMGELKLKLVWCEKEKFEEDIVERFEC